MSFLVFHDCPSKVWGGNPNGHSVEFEVKRGGDYGPKCPIHSMSKTNSGVPRRYFPWCESCSQHKVKKRGRLRGIGEEGWS